MTLPADRFGPFLTNRFGEAYLPAINGEIFSALGAEAHFRRYFEERWFNPDSLYLVVGSDSGLLVRYLLAHALPPGTHYLLVEPPDLLSRLWEALPPVATWPEAIHLCSTQEWSALAAKLGMRDYVALQNFHLERSMGAMDLLLSDYQEIWREVSRELGASQFVVKLESDSPYFDQRTLENLMENRRPALLVRGSCPGVTAVVLGSGPSVEGLLPWVKEQRERVLLITVGRLAGRLMALGMVPDVVISMDPNPVSFLENRDLLDLPASVLYFHTNHVVSTLPSQFRGINLYTGSLFPWDSPCNPANIMIAGLTVGNHAVDLAVELGCTQIVVGGLDYCYSREGYTHSRGMWERRTGPNVHPVDLLLETNGGWLAETRHDLVAAANTLGYTARSAQAAGCRIINPAPGALRIPDVLHLPVTEIDIAPPAQPVHEMLTASLGEESAAERLAHGRMVLAELERVRRLIEKMRDLAREGITCNDRLFGRKGKGPDFRAKQRMDAIETTLNGPGLLSFAKFIKLWGLAKFRGLAMMREEQQWSDAEIEALGRRYYEVYRDTCVLVLQVINLAMQRVRSRMEEERDKPNLKSLAEQWRRDGQWRRVQVWLARRGWQPGDLPPPWQPECQSLVEHYYRFQAELDVELKLRMGREAAPERILGKARYWFRQREQERLRIMVEGFADSEVAEPLAPVMGLIQGYLAELEGDMAQALAAYQQVVEPELRLEALVRASMMLLRLGEHQQAVQALQELEGLTPAFQPSLADLQRLLGQREAAAGTLRKYLACASDDPLAAMKLARVEGELGRTEAARQVLEQILARHPEHAAAQQMLQALPGAAAVV